MKTTTGVLPAYRPGFDLAGAMVSGACAVHCAAMPLVVAILPGAVARFAGSPLVHQVFAWAVLLTSALAFLPGWLRHRESRIWTWVFFGLGLIGAARCVEGTGSGAMEEVILTTAGGGLLLVAHRLNHTLAYWAGRD